MDNNQQNSYNMADPAKWSTLQTYSYVQDNEKYAKICRPLMLGSDISSGISMADPAKWSYAQTHSYVKINPAELNISVPSGIDEMYAKLIYIPQLSGIGGNAIVDEEMLNDAISRAVSGIGKGDKGDKGQKGDMGQVRFIKIIQNISQFQGKPSGYFYAILQDE